MIGPMVFQVLNCKESKRYFLNSKKNILVRLVEFKRGTI